MGIFVFGGTFFPKFAKTNPAKGSSHRTSSIHLSVVRPSRNRLRRSAKWLETLGGILVTR